MQVIYLENEGKVPFKLDKKDRKLLSVLASDARISANKIAKKIQVSPEVVRYRLARLKKEHVIIGARAIISLARLGYSSYHCFLQAKDSYAEVVDYLVNNPKVNTLIQFLGCFELEAALRVKHVGELEVFIQELSTRVSTQPLILQLTEGIKTTALPECITPLPTHAPQAKASTKATLDEKDISLLKALAENADDPITALMQKTHLSREQVSYRMKQLKKNCIIQAYVPVINYERLGYSMHCMLIKLSAQNPATLRRLKETIRGHQNVLWAVNTIGEYNILLYLLTSSNIELVKFVSCLTDNFKGNIAQYHLLIGLKEHKYSYLPNEFS